MRAASHEIYGRRRSRNVGLGLSLGGFVLLVFMVTVVKLNAGYGIGNMQPVAHVPPASLDASHIPPAAERAAARRQAAE
jgi:hypothetical protein